MTSLASALLVAGAVVIGLGVRIARSSISDRMVHSVIDAVGESSGADPSPEVMRAHIRRDRQRWGLWVGAIGAALIVAAIIAG